MKLKNNPTKILIAGEGGQGIQMIAKILADAARTHWYEISYIPHYGVEMRMGISFAYVQIAKGRQIGYPKFSKADILVVLAKRDLDIPKSFIDKDTVIINCIDLVNEPSHHHLPNKSFNIMCLGIISNELKFFGINLSVEHVRQIISKSLGHKFDLDANLASYDLGLKLDQNKYLKSLDKVAHLKLEPLVDQDEKKQVIRFPSLCKGCGLCLVKCPAHAIYFSKDERGFISRPMPKVNLEKCVACKTCENICPDSAIKIIKK